MIKIKNIIDIRDKIEYLDGHIPNSQNIELKELMNYPEKYLNKNDIYYIYCFSGIRSKKLVTILNKLGYHTVNLEGGYQNYLFGK